MIGHSDTLTGCKVTEPQAHRKLAGSFGTADETLKQAPETQNKSTFL